MNAPEKCPIHNVTLSRVHGCTLCTPIELPLGKKRDALQALELRAAARAGSRPREVLPPCEVCEARLGDLFHRSSVHDICPSCLRYNEKYPPECDGDAELCDCSHHQNARRAEATHEPLEMVAGRRGLKKLLIALASSATNAELDFVARAGSGPMQRIAKALLTYRGEERTAAELEQRKPPPPHRRRPYEPPAIVETRQLGMMNPSIAGPSWKCDAGHEVHGYGFCHLCRFGTGPLR